MRTRIVWLTAVFLIGFLVFSPSHAQEIENLLINGGFEDGVMEPWTTYGDATTEVVQELVGAAVDEGPIEGNHCLHIDITALGEFFYSIGLQHRGHSIFEQGKKYTLSAFLKCRSGTLDINFKPEHDGDPWTGYGAQAFTMTEEWTEFSITTPVFTEEVNPAEITFHIGYDVADFWIDSVRFYEGDYVPPSLGDKSVASMPVPEDGVIHPDTWASLSWKPGDSAVSHDVYFSGNSADVEAGAEAAFQGNQAADFLVVGFPGMPLPDGLVNGSTYYWRIDEVNEADPNSPWKGDVWSFTVPPKTAYVPDPADGAESVSIDGILRWTAGYGAKLHTVYFGDNFDDVNNAAGGQAQGSADYRSDTLKMATTYYWRVDEFDIVETHKGDVWSFITEGAVSNPVPAKGSVDVSQTALLGWTPGVFGTSHEVYFGTDAGSLELKSSGSLGSESYDPGQLEWNTTYYWRVDEANSANAESPWTGPLWSFATADFLVLDDMENYNDLDEGEPGSNRIYLAWADGFDNPAVNGSVVGHATIPFAEQTIVHGGNQSMPMTYDNAVGKSEATLTLTSNRDWTFKGLNTLTIWFRGSTGNAAENLYVALNGNAVVDHDNPDAAMRTSWTEWNIPLQAFADQGMNLANVNSMTIGLGNKNNPVAGGAGMMYFDDIRLYAR